MTSTDVIVYSASAVGSAGVLVWLGRGGLLPPLPGLPTFVVGSTGGRRKGAGAFGRDVSGVPAPIWLLCTAAVFLAMSLGASFAAALGPSVAGAAGTIRHQAITGACFFGAGAAASGVMLYLIYPRTTPATGIGTPGLGIWNDLWRGAACLALVAPVYILVAGLSQWVSERLSGQAAPTIAHSGLDMFTRNPRSPWALAFAAVAVVLTPFAEECMYRAFLQSLFLRLFGGWGGGGRGGTGTAGRGATWSAIAVTSAIFAALHALPGGKEKAGPVPWLAVPGLFVLAVGMGLAYERTKRLAVPMAMHGLFNLANLVMAASGTLG